MVDAHCHLYEIEDFDISNLDLVICAGAGIESNKKATACAQKYPNVYTTVGCHPEEMADFDEKILREQINQPKVVAIGECGLDYCENTTEAEKVTQRQLFKLQIELAKEKKLPLVVHCRNAFGDVFKMVDYDKVQMHCFNGNEEQMWECIKRGWYISLGGILTFKNSNKLRETIKKVPENLLLTETDAPWLSPEPFRGKKNNPSRVKYVLECMAKIRNIKYEKLDSKIEENARKLFGI